MHAMKTLKLALFVAIPVALFAVVSSQASAYFYQPQSYPQGYNPYQQVRPNLVRQITRENLWFVSDFIYIPSPMWYYPSYYNYFGGYYGGYGYGY